MDYIEEGKKEHRLLSEYSEARNTELTRIFDSESDVIQFYEILVCALTLILAESRSDKVHDRSIRDLMADTFDTLYFCRKAIYSGFFGVAFPLMRISFEKIALIHYFMLLPEKAKVWDSGKTIMNSEVRRFLDSQPMGEDGTDLKRFYDKYSSAIHLNRSYVPERFLGEGNEFVLGVIGAPDLFVVADFVAELLDLWFWFGAIISFNYRKEIEKHSTDFHRYYFKIAGRMETVAQELHERRLKYLAKDQGV